MVSVSGAEKDYGTGTDQANVKGVTYKKSADATVNPKTGKKAEGADLVVGNIANWWNDIRRGVGNLGGDVSSFLAGKNPVVGGNIGDKWFGRAWTDVEKGFTPTLPSAALPTPTGGIGGQAGVAASDILAAFSDPYAALRASTAQRGTENDARLQAMYQQVADYIRGTQDDTQAIYDTAAQNYQAGNTAAANAVNAGYGTARQQMTNAMNALGIQDAANVIASRGEDMSGKQTAATTDLARLLGLNLDRNTAAQTAALSNVLNQANATIGEGARARSAYQQSIANQLAQLDAQSSNARNSYLQSVAASQADAEAAAAKANASAKTAINADQYMTEYTNAYNKFKEQNYTDEAARSAAESYMKAWYGNKAIS